MKHSIKVILSSLVIWSLTFPASAYLIDFINEADNAKGESAWNPLSYTFSDVTLSITGNASNDNESTQFAYLDAKNAGLGVCKDASKLGVQSSTNRSNVCDSGAGDDNVTVGESLTFNFNSSVNITGIWFNNNHDEGFAGTSSSGDYIDIGGFQFFTGNMVKEGSILSGTNYGYQNDVLYSSVTSLGVNDDLQISFGNEQFYVSAIEFETAVPEPSILVLIGVGFAGLVFSRRRKQQA